MPESQELPAVGKAITRTASVDRPASLPEDERLLMEKLSRTETEIERIEVYLENLRAVAEDCREQLFIVRAPRAPIARVPDDVLALIFEAVAEDLRPRFTRCPHDRYSYCDANCKDLVHRLPYQIICGQVCRRWRLLVFQTPTLWSKFRIEHTPQLEYARATIAMIPFDFGVNIIGSYWNYDDTPVPAFVAENVGRLAYMDVEAGLLRMPIINNLCFLQVRELVVKTTGRQADLDTAHLTSFPHLDRLSIYHCTMTCSVPCLSSVRRLALVSVTIEARDLAVLLTDCSRLQRLRLSGKAPTGSQAARTVLNVIRMTDLTHLHLDLFPDAMVLNYATFQMPRLLHLSLGDTSDGTTDFDSLWIEFLQRMDPVEHLHFESTPDMKQFLDLLCRPEAQLRPLLPSLRRLALKAADFPEAFGWPPLPVRSSSCKTVLDFVRFRAETIPLQVVQVRPSFEECDARTSLRALVTLEELGLC